MQTSIDLIILFFVLVYAVYAKYGRFIITCILSFRPTNQQQCVGSKLPSRDITQCQQLNETIAIDYGSCDEQKLRGFCPEWLSLYLVPGGNNSNL